jgi:CubicO group peptidase (beta-lactamase class C family)
VDRYLPLKKGKYPTIRQLLTHTAGYGPLTPVEMTVPKLIARRYQKANPYRGVKTEDVLSCLERRNRCRGNYTYCYSDFPYAVLAAVSFSVTGKTIAEDLNCLIKEDFGFENTEIATEGRTANTFLKAKPIEPWHWEEDNPYIAGGGIVSDIVDMTAYGALQIESDVPFVGMTHILEESSFSKRGNIGTTLGWRTYKQSNQLWHVGAVGTFRCSMIVNCHSGMAVVVLGNAKGIRNANVHYLAKMLYSDLKNKRIKFE